MAKKKKAVAKKKSKKLSGKQLDKVTGGEGLILASDGLRKPDEDSAAIPIMPNLTGRLAADEAGLIPPDRGLLKRR